MKIEIRGYKNLENFEMEINDNAINLVMGMSGSGKSSIGGAILRKDLEQNITQNYDGEQIIKVDGSTDFDSIMYFSNETCESYLSKNINEDYYDIFVDDKAVVESARNVVLTKLKNLKNALEQSEDDYNACLRIAEDLGGKKLNKGGNLSQRANLVLAKKELNKVRNDKILKRIGNIGIDKLAWMKAGNDYIKDKRCPYCEKVMSEDFISDNKSMFDLDQKPLGKLFNHMKELGVDIENVLSKMSVLEEEVTSIVKAVEEYRLIKDSIGKIEDLDLKSINEIEVTGELEKYFGSLCKVLNDFNNGINEYRNIVANSNNATKKVLKKRTGSINNELNKMSIPYKVEAIMSKGKIESYTLSMIDDKESRDRREAMSTGERNIFSLVLFIYKCIKSDCKLIIIDDPASYYDDYRKHEIYKLISEKLKGKTILMMTHDSVYAKYMLSNSRQGKNNIVYYMENAGDVSVKKVCKEDFNIFEDYVRNRLKEVTDYYQKIVNLRILCEGRNANKAYGYLSAIIHLKSKEEVQEDLKNAGRTEKEILDEIKEEYKIELDEYKGAQKYIDLSDYSIFEKMFIAREQSSFNKFKDELSEAIHINRMLRVCLDPYKFNFCTKRLYCALQDFKELRNN